jgi:hypothetical protein
MEFLLLFKLVITGGCMDITKAIEILEHYRDENGLPYMLETLQDIQENYEDLNPVVQTAFNVFMRMGRKMFAQRETA